VQRFKKPEQEFEFPDEVEDEYAHLDEDAMVMLMELAGYRVVRKHYKAFLPRETDRDVWYLAYTPPNGMEEHYNLPTCNAFQRTKMAFKVFMFRKNFNSQKTT
jgi:hypothetical protein